METQKYVGQRAIIRLRQGNSRSGRFRITRTLWALVSIFVVFSILAFQAMITEGSTADPTIWQGQSSTTSQVIKVSASAATYAQKGFPDTPTGTSQRNIYVGDDKWFNKKQTRGFWKFNLPNLGEVNIISARIQLGQYACEASSNYGVTAYRVTGSWDENTLTWNNQPSVAEAVGSATFSTGDGTKEIDITGLVRQWYAGTYPNRGVSIRRNTETSPGGIFCSRSGTSTQCEGQINPKLRIEYEVVAPTPTPFPTVQPPAPTPIPQPGECKVPFFTQVDSRWKNHPLRTNGGYGICSSYCSTIGHCGCTLTSAAMVFKYYGANTTRYGKSMNPANLSDCMGKKACPFVWGTGAWCTNGKAQDGTKYVFSWSRLDRELNQNHRPVILGMYHKTKGYTHWVVVLSGSGSNPSNYRIHDPAMKGGANVRLSTRSSSWAFDSIKVYKGTANCTAVNWEFEAFDPASLQPEPLQLVHDVGLQPVSATFTHQIAAPALTISGTVWLYTMTELTMTVEMTAASSVGNVVDMVIWTDTISNTNWQTFSPFVWTPLSEFVYVQYRDTLGNVTDVYSATTDLIGPLDPIDIYEVYLPIVIKE